MEPNWQFVLVFTAVAVGWVLGRFSLRETLASLRVGRWSEQDYRGLTFLLTEQSDAAIDAFVESLEVNADTLETHLALGSLMRKRGEVERAIRIHQNLLARPSLGETQLQQAHLELARDFISAGILGRAEKLLLDLAEQSSELQDTALRHLLDIYQQERGWLKALDTARRLRPRRSLFGAARRDRLLDLQQSHYCCELADQALQRRD
ncbi:MAG TPA: lipopolysaccharide assembly protein LapB, partial [Spongiibacteraceae bacterium]|nr:lipopolysaccharide assembly protein LapB [Spongiibacteraceae bacterium]